MSIKPPAAVIVIKVIGSCMLVTAGLTRPGMVKENTVFGRIGFKTNLAN